MQWKVAIELGYSGKGDHGDYKCQIRVCEINLCGREGIVDLGVAKGILIS